MTIRLSLGGVLSVLSPDIQLSLGESAGFSADIRLSLVENFRECSVSRLNWGLGTIDENT